jgi:hypothetical protein
LTHETEGNILITGETWTRLSQPAESRGKAELRGVSEPVPLYAPQLVGQAEPAAEPEPVGAQGEGDGLGSALRRRLPARREFAGARDRPRRPRLRHRRRPARPPGP